MTKAEIIEQKEQEHDYVSKIQTEEIRITPFFRRVKLQTKIGIYKQLGWMLYTAPKKGIANYVETKEDFSSAEVMALLTILAHLIRCCGNKGTLVLTKDFLSQIGTTGWSPAKVRSLDLGIQMEVEE